MFFKCFDANASERPSVTSQRDTYKYWCTDAHWA